MSHETTRLAWEDGWLSLARRCPSPNFGLRPAGVEPDLLVLHNISLPPGCYGGEEIERLFTNRLDWEAHPYFGEIRGLQVSAHFLIRRDGASLQFVSCDDRAWHAGQSCYGARDNCNDFSVGVELEGTDDEPYTTPQYDTLTTIVAALIAHYPRMNQAAIAGHSDIAAGRKTDPGPAFDWARLHGNLLAVVE